MTNLESVIIQTSFIYHILGLRNESIHRSMTFSKKSFPSLDEECFLNKFQFNLLLLLCCAIDPDGLDIPLEIPELLLWVETDPLQLLDLEGWKWNGKNILLISIIEAFKYLSFLVKLLGMTLGNQWSWMDHFWVATSLVYVIGKLWT